MLITKTLKIKTTNKNVGYYKQFYPNINSGDEIEINVDQLPPTSKQHVIVQCDGPCKKEFEIHYYSYLRNIEHYGYYTCKECCIEKVSKTLNDKYGVDYPLQSEEFLNKMYDTNLERYGVKFSARKKECREKGKQTCLEKYGKEFYTQTDEHKQRREKTCLEKYNEVHPMKNKEVYDKFKKTNLEKHGVEFPGQIEEGKIKLKQTKLEKYGDENYNNREKFKKTMLKLYSGENASEGQKIKDKRTNTMLERHGFKYAAQSPEFYDKMIKNGYSAKWFQDVIYYQGTYELDFLERYYHKLKIVRGPFLKYNFNCEDKYYSSDFYCEEFNLIVEIKSDYFYYKDIDKNVAKENSCREQGFNFVFIINKNYNDFEKIIKFQNLSY